MKQIKHIGMNIRLRRVHRGWSQETLAELAGLDRSYIGAVERGNINVGINNLIKIADVLDVDVTVLISTTIIVTCESRSDV